MAKITKAIHDIGTAVWWGGTLMGTLAMNPAVEVLDDPEERGKMVDEGWARFQPWAAAGLLATIVTHICMRRHPPEDPSPCYQTAAVAKDLLIGAAVVSSVASLALGEYSTPYELDGYNEEGFSDDHDDEPVQSGLTVASWVQLLSGVGILVAGAVMATERQKVKRWPF